MQCDAPCCTNRAAQQLLVDAQPLARVCSERCGYALLESIGMPRRPYNEDDDEEIQAVKRIPAASAPPSAEMRAQMFALMPLARKPFAASSSSSAGPPPAASSSSSSSSSSARPPPAASSSSSSSSAARPPAAASSSSSSSARPVPAAASSSSSSGAAAAASSSSSSLARPASSSAATVAPLLPAAAAAPAADEREPVARTLLQVNGITPAIAAKLGFDVYRLLEAGDSEPAMRALLAPAFEEGGAAGVHDLVARAPIRRNDELDVATQHALSWVRIHRDRVARWRAAHPGRALPDPARPSGWLQDVPGLNPKLLNAPENARRLGIGTTDALRDYYRANGLAATRLRLTEAGYVHGKQKVDLLTATAYVSWLP